MNHEMLKTKIERVKKLLSAAVVDFQNSPTDRAKTRRVDTLLKTLTKLESTLKNKLEIDRKGQDAELTDEDMEMLEGFTWDFFVQISPDEKADKLTVHHDYETGLFQVKQGSWKSPGVILSEKQLGDLLNAINVYSPNGQEEMTEGKKKKQKTPVEKIRKPTAPPGQAHKDKNKYTRKTKHKDGSVDEGYGDQQLDNKWAKFKKEWAALKDKYASNPKILAVLDTWYRDGDHPRAAELRLRQNEGKTMKPSITVKQLAKVLYESGDYKYKKDAGAEATEFRKSGRPLQLHPTYLKESAKNMAFTDMVKLVIESGGQVEIDPVDEALFDWATRVSKAKYNESQKQEIYAGMLYERNGGVFNLHDILSED